MDSTHKIAFAITAKKNKVGLDRQERGFALLVVMLIVVLLLAVSIGLLMMVTAEGKVGGYDTQNTVAYHAAEGAIEKMTSDLASSFTNIQSPRAADITALSADVPANTASLRYLEYNFTPEVDANGNLVSKFKLITTGPNQGLFAEIIPVQLKATVQTGLNAQVSMMRDVEVALIPVFQFGVFSDSDLGFYSSPNLEFDGRVHTNGDLYLGVSNGATITFNDKITAWGNVVREILPNGLVSTNFNNNGTVNILAAPSGCKPAVACKAMALNQGSVVNGPTSAQNPAWNGISKGTYNGWIIDGNFGKPGGTGAVQLKLPFTMQTAVGAAAAGPAQQAYQIIRRPLPTDTAATTDARLYTQAEIRVLLSDDPAELPGGPADSQNIRLANVQTNAGAPDFTRGVPASTPGGLPVLPGSATYNTYFAEASMATLDPTGWSATTTKSLPPDWPTAPAAPPAGHATLTPAGAPIIKPATSWNLIDGYLRVEYRDTTGNYIPVTKEWLELGFARGLTPPKVGAPNPINPNAILLFQQPADRDGNGTLDPAALHNAKTCPTCIDRPADTPTDIVSNSAFFGSSGSAGSVTRNNWYPINFYDAREGEARDQDVAGSSCTVNGIMNAVELDVNNLKKWLAGTIGTSGNAVEFNKDNGYILYFSDRRGMGLNPNSGNIKTGDSGLEDVINAASVTGVPDQTLEPPAPGKTLSPEDVNQNGLLDNFGAWNLGAGFSINTGTTPGNLNPFGTARLANCFNNAGAGNPPLANPPGRKNWVSGARHVLKLVDGTLGNVPTKPDGTGGFTVASENPVYILGDYNSDAADTVWAATPVDQPHSAAAVIADTVTLLSNNWSDGTSLLHPTGATGNRPGVTTYYRVAVAAGKNITFPSPAYAQTATLYGFGTDGGVHNFLRFLEDWTGQTLNYTGSMVSLYYSTYNTGAFKCCNDAVYHPPARNYQFDLDFQDPTKLPPGTPMFRDVNNLSFQQNFNPSTLPVTSTQF